MAITLDRTAVKTNSAASTSLATVWDLGTPPADGRMMVAVVAAILQTTITPPAGWTLLATQDAGSNLRAWLYYRWASSEAGAPTWTIGSATKGWAWVGAYNGVQSATTPVYAASSSTTAGTSFTGPGVAVPEDGWRIDAIATRRANNGTATAWSSFSDALAAERLDFGSNAGSADIAGAVYDSNRDLAAETAARTFHPSNTEAIAAMFAVSLSAAAGGGPPRGAAGARWGLRL